VFALDPSYDSIVVEGWDGHFTDGLIRDGEYSYSGITGNGYKRYYHVSGSGMNFYYATGMPGWRCVKAGCVEASEQNGPQPVPSDGPLVGDWLRNVKQGSQWPVYGDPLFGTFGDLPDLDGSYSPEEPSGTNDTWWSSNAVMVVTSGVDKISIAVYYDDEALAEINAGIAGSMESMTNFWFMENGALDWPVNSGAAQANENNESLKNIDSATAGMSSDMSSLKDSASVRESLLQDIIIGLEDFDRNVYVTIEEKTNFQMDVVYPEEPITYVDTTEYDDATSEYESMFVDNEANEAELRTALLGSWATFATLWWGEKNDGMFTWVQFELPEIAQVGDWGMIDLSFGLGEGSLFGQMMPSFPVDLTEYASFFTLVRGSALCMLYIGMLAALVMAVVMAIG